MLKFQTPSRANTAIKAQSRKIPPGLRVLGFPAGIEKEQPAWAGAISPRGRVLFFGPPAVSLGALSVPRHKAAEKLVLVKTKEPILLLWKINDQPSLVCSFHFIPRLLHGKTAYS